MTFRWLNLDFHVYLLQILFIEFVIFLDIMECTDGLHNCSQVCVEREGEFGCACYGGYDLLEDGVSCEGM